MYVCMCVCVYVCCASELKGSGALPVVLRRDAFATHEDRLASTDFGSVRIMCGCIFFWRCLFELAERKTKLSFSI